MIDICMRNSQKCSYMSPFGSMSRSFRIVTLLAIALSLSACDEMAGGAKLVQVVDPLDEHQALARDIFRELVEINTTDSVGDNTVATEAVARRLLDAGFAEDDVEVLAPAPRKGNLVARLHGSDPDAEPLMLLAHLDVVEADVDAWERDPFDFIEEDGYFYGRGVSDDKDEAAIHVANLIRLKNASYTPSRDIVLVLTADEEGGEYNGVQWLLEKHPEKMWAKYVLSEGGGGVLIGGQHVVNEVQLAEKQYETLLIETDSKGGHSSMPSSDNSIYALLDTVGVLRNYEFPVTLNPVTREFFRRSSELHSGPLRDAMEGILQEPPDPKSVEFLSEMPFYNASMRTTCVPTMIQGGHAENALPQRVTLTVNCRFLPTESREDLRERLQSMFGDGATVRWKSSDDAPSSFTEAPDAMAVIERVSKTVWPNVPVVPIMGPGGTDGRFLRDIDITVLGVNGIFIDVEDDRAHAKNERLRVRSFYDGQEFLYRLTKALSE